MDIRGFFLLACRPIICTLSSNFRVSEFVAGGTDILLASRGSVLKLVLEELANLLIHMGDMAKQCHTSCILIAIIDRYLKFYRNF